MGHEQKLRTPCREDAQEARKSADVGFIERGVDLVEHRQWQTGRRTVRSVTQCKQEGQAGHGSLPCREQGQAARPLALGLHRESQAAQTSVTVQFRLEFAQAAKQFARVFSEGAAHTLQGEAGGLLFGAVYRVQVRCQLGHGLLHVHALAAEILHAGAPPKARRPPLD